MRKVSAALVVVAVGAVYLLRLDRAVGLIVDDAWYVLLGRALAEGRGFVLVSAPGAQILPSAPIGFPAILSLVFRIAPDFPRNLWLLKAVSLAAMCGVGLVSYRYFSRDRELPGPCAAGIAIATVLVPAFVFLATSTVMSECLFTFVQLLGIMAVERAARHGNQEDAHRLRLTLLAAVLVAAAFLIRSMAVALVVAATLAFLKERQWRKAVVFLVVVLVCVAPWMIYVRAHASTREQRAEHGGSIAYTYTEQVWMRWAGAPNMGTAGVGDLPARVRDNLIDVFSRNVGALVVPVAFRGPTESGQEVVALGGTSGLSQASMGGAPATLMISILLSAIALVGFIAAARRRLTVAEIMLPMSLAIVLVWPFWTYRFVLPLAPFVFFYLVMGLRTFSARWMADSWRVPRMALLCVIGFSAWDHISYLLERARAQEPSRIDWLAESADTERTLAWMRENLIQEGAVATTNPALVHMATGRQTVSIDGLDRSWEGWRRLGVRYAAVLRPSRLTPGAYGGHTVLYHSPRDFWVIELDP